MLIKDLFEAATHISQLSGRLDKAEKQIIELERRLGVPPCPRCFKPEWREVESRTTQGPGADFGLLDSLKRCSSCGHERWDPPKE